MTWSCPYAPYSSAVFRVELGASSSPKMAWGGVKGMEDLVARLLENDASLHDLCLLRNRRFQSDEDAEVLCNALASNSVLKTLTICSHHISPGMAAAFGRMLQRNRSLTSLALGTRTLGDEASHILW
jgi:hypothetical protein